MKLSSAGDGVRFPLSITTSSISLPHQLFFSLSFEYNPARKVLLFSLFVSRSSVFCPRLLQLELWSIMFQVSRFWKAAVLILHCWCPRKSFVSRRSLSKTNAWCSGRNINPSLNDRYKYTCGRGRPRSDSTYGDNSVLSCVLSDVKLLRLGCRSSACRLRRVPALLVFCSAFFHKMQCSVKVSVSKCHRLCRN
jgi:hypothetical protein